MHGISDINWLYYKYYADHPELKRIVMIHSEQVAQKALSINKTKILGLDEKEIYCAAMLHDIGVVRCNAPSIHAHGVLPYIQHGIAGKEILDKNKLDKFSNICITHTGSGITLDEIKKNKLPLPLIDMTPKTMLEKLICYSDKFFSKSCLMEEKPISLVIDDIKKFGFEAQNRFMELHTLFG